MLSLSEKENISRKNSLDFFSVNANNGKIALTQRVRANYDIFRLT